MWICLALSLLIIGVAAVAGRMVGKNPPPEKIRVPDGTGHPDKKNLALEGARLVFKSRYLLAIVAIVGLYEIISTTMDFQFTSTVAHFLDGDAIGKQISTMYLITNIFAMIFQLFLTSYIMTRFGIKIALMVLPGLIILGSVGFMAFPILWMGCSLNLENGLNYSINQSSKESLYTATTREEKYKAKAFIDMFVMRFSKAIAVGVNLAITTVFVSFSSIRWLSLFSLAMVTIWIFAALYAGSRFKEEEKAHRG
jgi:AAA family ATP:ADP antiporter